MEINRSADAALKGYAYQFNQTILEILRSTDDSIVTIEGVEDIDLTTATVETVVQCKYFAAQKFTLPGIREAVALMLADSASDPLRRYRLYIHCGDMSGYVKVLELETLKECLTIKRKKPLGQVDRLYDPYCDDQLRSFCGRLKIDAGESYEIQSDLVVRSLRAVLGGSEADSIELFAPSARDLIFGLAIQASVDDRRITRRQFVRQLDTKRGLYTRWHREQIGEDRFVAALKRQIRAARAIDPLRDRMLMADIEQHFDMTLAVAARLASAAYGEGHLRSARPWTVLLQGSADDVSRFKRELLARSVKLHDGFEDLLFQPVMFDEPPVVNTKPNSQRIALTSYVLRVVGLETYLANIVGLRMPNSVFTLSVRSPPGLERETYHLASLPSNRIMEVLGV
jgi:hypothetical protein